MQDSSQSTAPPMGAKNYVFVDEHNRQKRLKVIRACEACRRRKIKCDSATTNTWPCAGCIRLKLQCVPPAGTSATIDQTDGQLSHSYGESLDMQSMSTLNHANIQYFGHPTGFRPSPYSRPPDALTVETSFAAGYDVSGVSVLTHPNYGHVPVQQHLVHPENQLQQTIQQYNAVVIPPRPTTPSLNDRKSSEELVQHLGVLMIQEDGVAEYVRQQNKDRKAPDVPRVDIEVNIEDIETHPGSQICIPPLLMPTDEEALRLFALFFIHVHPYIPVLCRNHFYDQWHNHRDSLSPLLLEAIFACATRVSENPNACLRWLALAEKHVMLYLDSPRLTTIQALLLLLKAKEWNPKQGYFYKSWMTCKTVVAMAKDLELDTHRELHQTADSCDDDLPTCLIKTRIWQTIFVCETMIGGPQGRTDRGANPETVEINPTYPASDIDDYERQISRQYSFSTRNIHGVRLAGDVFREMKKKKDWTLDPQFDSLNKTFEQFYTDLPADLKISMPDNGAPPNIPSHFIGNLAIYYQLSILVLHRPQLSISQSFTTDSLWKHHMKTCYDAARTMCRLQEAMLSNYGLPGLDYMIRGFSFTNYATLTCIMIHLIALTSPDPEFNTDARDYFVRHMRILEKSSGAWSMPETIGQIDSLRAAFSADLGRPFELKPSFPLGTPPEQHRPIFPSRLTPEPALSYLGYGSQYAQTQFNMSRSSSTPTPPISTKSSDSKPHSPENQHGYILDQTRYGGMMTSPYGQTRSTIDQSWNPNPIIKQFSTAFMVPSSAMPPLTSGYSASPSGSTHSLHAGFPPTASPAYTSAPYQFQQYYPEVPQQLASQPYLPTEQEQYIASGTTGLALHSPHSQTTPLPGFGPAPITPQEWQQSVASAYGSGTMKRTWDYSNHNHLPDSR